MTQFVVTPEPATWVAAVVGVGLAALHRARSRRRNRAA
ncbi:MAG: PEP-CTERM sorting domain-containing protein [Planctomycetaceae bacterium]